MVKSGRAFTDLTKVCMGVTCEAGNANYSVIPGSHPVFFSGGLNFDFVDSSVFSFFFSS